MASKTIDEILKNMSPESRAAIEKMSPETKNAVQQTGQGLEKQGVAEKPEYQENGRRAAQARTGVPKLNDTVFPNQQKPETPQRGAQIIGQTRSKAAELGQKQEKSTPAPDRNNER